MLGFEALAALAASAVSARGSLGGIDFRAYWVAARIGVANGWERIYDPALQRPALQPYFAASRGFAAGYWAPFVTTPPAAWLAVPLAGADFRVAWAIWSFVIAAAVVVSAWLLAPPRAWVRIGFVLLLLASTIGWAAGNIVALVLLSVALAAWLARSGRPSWAGAALVLVVLKPQVALLVIPAVLAAGRFRTVAFWAAGALALGLVSLASLGQRGVASYADLLRVVGSNRAQTQLSVVQSIHPTAVQLAWVLLVAVATLVIGRTWRHRSDAVVLGIGLIGSFLVAPYLNGQDLVLLAAASGVLVLEAYSGMERIVAAVLAACSTFLASGSVLPPAVAGTAVLAVAAAGHLRQRRSAPA